LLWMVLFRLWLLWLLILLLQRWRKVARQVCGRASVRAWL